MPQENFVNNDVGFQRFCDINLATLNKHALCKKNMFEVIKCLSSIKNYHKQLWQELNYTIIYYKIRVGKIEKPKALCRTKKRLCVFFTKGQKEILRNFKWKICHLQYTLLEDIKTSFVWSSCGSEQNSIDWNGKLIKTHLETAEILNDFFFSNVV